MVFHVLNRGAGRRVLFSKAEDFLAFERVVDAANSPDAVVGLLFDVRVSRMPLLIHLVQRRHVGLS